MYGYRKINCGLGARGSAVHAENPVASAPRFMRAVAVLFLAAVLLFSNFAHATDYSAYYVGDSAATVAANHATRIAENLAGLSSSDPRVQAHAELSREYTLTPFQTMIRQVVDDYATHPVCDGSQRCAWAHTWVWYDKRMADKGFWEILTNTVTAITAMQMLYQACAAIQGGSCSFSCPASMAASCVDPFPPIPDGTLGPCPGILYMDYEWLSDDLNGLDIPASWMGSWEMEIASNWQVPLEYTGAPYDYGAYGTFSEMTEIEGAPGGDPCSVTGPGASPNLCD
jgi:hypothetical protein